MKRLIVTCVRLRLKDALKNSKTFARIYNMKKIIFAVFILCFAFASCKSNKEIPADLTADQLLQMGQDAFAKGQYKTSEKYYNEVINRYGDNIDKYVEARYEIGHVSLKRKKYEKAYWDFQEILDLYAQTEIGTIPPAYKKLAAIGMSKIPEKEIEKILAERNIDNYQTDLPELQQQDMFEAFAEDYEDDYEYGAEDFEYEENEADTDAGVDTTVDVIEEQSEIN